jgi:hypothetical protein
MKDKSNITFLFNLKIAEQVLLDAGALRVRHFSGFEFSLLPNRVHAHPNPSQRKPLTCSLQNAD